MPKSSGVNILVRMGLINTGTNWATAVPVIMVVTFPTKGESFSLLISIPIVFVIRENCRLILWSNFFTNVYNRVFILLTTWKPSNF